MKYSLHIVLTLLVVSAGLAAGQTSGQTTVPVSDPPVVEATQVVAVQSAELVEKAKFHDGKEILFEGEAIGDPLTRGDHAWVNVLGESYALGVWMTKGDRARIVRYGSYTSGGDRLAIRGVFYRACPEHGGDMDIHADSVSVVGRGKSVLHATPPAKLVFAPLLLACAAVLYLLWKKRETLLRPENRRRQM